MPFSQSEAEAFGEVLGETREIPGVGLYVSFFDSERNRGEHAAAQSAQWPSAKSERSVLRRMVGLYLLTTPPASYVAMSRYFAFLVG